MRYAIAFLALVLSTPAMAMPMKCSVTDKSVCGAGSSCKAAPLTTWAKVDLQTGAYSRCDRLGCDTYQGVVTRSGIWSNISMPDHGMLARVSDAGSFVEIVTLTDVVYVSHGNCRRA